MWQLKWRLYIQLKRDIQTVPNVYLIHMMPELFSYYLFSDS